MIITATYIREEANIAVDLLDCPAKRINSNQLIKIIEKVDYDVIIYFTPYLAMNGDYESYKFISSSENRKDSIKYVFSGTGPSWKPEYFIDNKNVFVVRGEPEKTILELIKFFIDGNNNFGEIDGLSFLYNNDIKNNKFRELMDIKDLPAPDYNYVDGSYYLNRLDVTPIVTMCNSRGCAYRCAFCAPNAVDQAIEVEYKKLQKKYISRPPLRLRTEDQVIEDFRNIKRFGFNGIEIVDNCFVWGKKRTLNICNAIKELNLKFICLSRANLCLDEEIIKALKDAGCQIIYFGTESFVQEILDDIKKDLLVSDVYKAVNNCKKVGLEPEVSVVFGASPLETKATVNKSLMEARKLGTRFVHYSIALPFPNCEMYDWAKDNNWFVNSEFEPIDNVRESIIDLPNLKAKELESILKRAYFSQYFNIKNLFSELKKIGNRRAFKNKIKAAIKFLKFYFRGK